MSYSTAFPQAISIILYIHVKMEDFEYRFMPIKTIAEALNIPAPTVVKIIKSLNAAGITTSKEGASGGILLSKPLSTITLLDVFLAIEPGKPLFKAQTKYGISGEYVDHLNRNLLKSLRDAEEAMKKSLQSVRLVDMLR